MWKLIEPKWYGILPINEYNKHVHYAQGAIKAPLNLQCQYQLGYQYHRTYTVDLPVIV